MDVTPKTLREAVFREKLRGGYHPDDVDEFLEQVATGVEALHDRLRQALDRAQRAESAAASSPESSGGGADEAVRTLVLAQRTADMAVQEAREQASRILANAEQQARTIVASAEERGRRHEEATLASTRSELTKLESVRAQAQQEVEALNRWIEEHKAHLASVLRDAMAVVERSGAISPPPTSHPIDAVRREPAAPPASRQEPAPAEAPSPAAATPDPAPAEGPDTAMWTPSPDVSRTGGDDAPERPAGQATVNAGLVAHHAASNAGASPGGGGADPIDPAEQALDEFFVDDPNFVDDRRFGGRLRRKR